MPPSAPVAGGAPPFLRLRLSGGFGGPTVEICILLTSGVKPVASTLNVQTPERSPIMEKRPLSSVTAVKLLTASGFSARTVAPLIGWSLSSLITPPTRPVWAAAAPAQAPTSPAASAARMRCVRKRIGTVSQYILNRPPTHVTHLPYASRLHGSVCAASRNGCFWWCLGRAGGICACR